MMAERKQKCLRFWCEVKYHVGHKCVKSQLYQLFLKPYSDGEGEEFQECPKQLENPHLEESPPQSLILALHAIQGTQGHNTMRIANIIKAVWAIIMVDSRSTHNFIDAKLVGKFSLLVR